MAPGSVEAVSVGLGLKLPPSMPFCYLSVGSGTLFRVMNHILPAVCCSFWNVSSMRTGVSLCCLGCSVPSTCRGPATGQMLKKSLVQKVVEQR